MPDHKRASILFKESISMLLFIVVPVYIPTSSITVSPFLQVHQHCAISCSADEIAILTSVKNISLYL